LAQGLQELAVGKGDVLMKLSDYSQGRGTEGSYSNAREVGKAIRCVDDPPLKDRASAEEAAHRIDAGTTASPLYDDERTPALAVCAFWPVPHTSEPHAPKVPGLPKVLVVASTGDPVTPYEGVWSWRKRLAAVC
jgi:TAP-like protein